MDRPILMPRYNVLVPFRIRSLIRTGCPHLLGKLSFRRRRLGGRQVKQLGTDSEGVTDTI